MSKNIQINPPSRALVDDAYLAECMFVVEPSLMSLMARAEEAGWAHDQVVLAIMCIGAVKMENKTLIFPGS